MEIVKSNAAHLSLADSGLSTRARLFEQTLESLNDAVLIKDLNAVVVFWNKAAAELYGFTAQEAVGRCVRELHAAVLSEEAYAAMLAQLHSGLPQTSNVERRKKNGQLVHVRMQKTPIFDDQDVLMGETTIARDVSEIKKIEEALSLAKESIKDKRDANRNLKREIKLRHQSELAQSNLNQRLQGTVNKLETLRSDNDSMMRMAELLQSCADLIEGYGVIANMMEVMFPQAPGTLYIYRDSRDFLMQSIRWLQDSGVDQAQIGHLSPQDCWALRLGHPHYGNGSGEIRCKHVASDVLNTVCLPIYGDGQVLGLMQLDFAVEEETKKRLRALISRIGPGLANLKLRESLRSLALRDGLTGLYNRRFFDDALERTISIMERSAKPFSMIMIDIDHFKRFNDSYGHEAGDFVLRAVAKCIANTIRSSDMACRYGGEELIVLLPDTNAEQAVQRAEEIRTAMCELSLICAGQTLPTPTASFGVVGANGHKAQAAEILKAVDNAMYLAKAQGRDQVCLAS
ncbi:MAG: sensor domain-containing diguanylate cyclase [Burkholderiaceae bacterium]